MTFAMVDSHAIDIDGVGSILFVRSRRAKRVVICIRLSKGVRVAVPARVSFEKALEFVNSKKTWIQKHLASIAQIENQRQPVSSTVIDKIDAKERLTSRLRYLAGKHRFSFNKVSIRNQRTRWGSCSHKKNISLNIKLVLLPDELVDYVILHELVHTNVHDHSKRFWSELDKHVGYGKSRAMASRVRKYDLGIGRESIAKL